MYLCDCCGELSTVLAEMEAPAKGVQRLTQQWKTVRISVRNDVVWAYGMVCTACAVAVVPWMSERSAVLGT